MSRRPPLVPLTVLCLAAASLLLAACGGSSPTNSASAEASREQKAETKFADFAKCLREHGVNAEAISHPGGGHGLKVSPGQAGGGPAAMEAAEKACARYRPAPKQVNLSPQQKVEQEEAVQKFAKCMREHGIKVEASAQGGGVQIKIHAHPGAEGGPNPESPAFQSAQQACQKLLPFKGGARARAVRRARTAQAARAGKPAGSPSAPVAESWNLRASRSRASRRPRPGCRAAPPPPKPTRRAPPPTPAGGGGWPPAGRCCSPPRPSRSS